MSEQLTSSSETKAESKFSIRNISTIILLRELLRAMERGSVSWLLEDSVTFDRLEVGNSVMVKELIRREEEARGAGNE